MTEDERSDLLMLHDKHIDVMSQSIEHLAAAVGTTNRKMDDIIDVISAQNVINEKLVNMDTNVRESFNRVHDKIRVVEDAQNTAGCSALKVLNGGVTVNTKDISAIHDDIGDLQIEQRKHLPHWAIKWLATILVMQAIAFGTK